MPIEETLPSVREYLENTFGGNYSGKGKCECPQCRHQTLTIKGDTLAKCWRGQCGFVLTSSRIKSPATPILQRLLWDFVQRCQEFKLAALENQAGLGSGAIDYLLNERKLHRDVVMDTITLGVVPVDFDWDGFTAPYREQLLGVNDPQAALKELDEQIANLKTAAKQLWLSFAYTDLHHRITSIKFRQPGAKSFSWYTQGKEIAKGAFDTLLTDPNSPPPGRVIVLCEGEFNVLQLQSLLKRNGIIYAATYALGSTTTIDKTLVGNLTEWKLALFEDNDDSGRSLTASLADIRKFRLVQFPLSDDDLDSFIVRFSDPKACLESLQKMMAEARVIYRNREAIRQEIEYIRVAGKPKPLAPDMIARLMVHELKERGKFLTAPRGPYYYCAETKAIFPLHKSSTEAVYYLHSFGLNPAVAKFHDAALNELAKKAYEDGEFVEEIYQIWHYDASKNRLYWCNGPGQVIRITETSIDIVYNGIDGVMFEPPDDYQPFEFIKKQDIEADADFLQNLLFRRINFASNGLPRAANEKLLEYWMLSLPFDSLNPTRPITAFLGEKGSGKTSLAKRFGMFMFGKDFNASSLPSKPEAFDVLVTNQPYIVLDNVDDKKTWLNDKLATAATGNKVELRALYTTNQLVRFPVRSILVITSRTPEFRRDDVADRLLIFNLARIQGNVPESELEREVLEHRNIGMSLFMDRLQQALKTIAVTEAVPSSFRMADFASFCLRLAQGAGEDDYRLMQGIFGTMQRMQEKFTAEQDPLCLLLLKFAELHIEKACTAMELIHQLKALASEHRIPMPQDIAPQTLGIRLSNGVPELAGYVQIEVVKGAHGYNRYQVRLVGTSVSPTDSHSAQMSFLEPF